MTASHGPPHEVAVRLNMAAELREKIQAACITRAQHPEHVELSSLSAMAGTLSYHLRCALNYAMHHFIEVHLRPRLADAEYRSLALKADFPLVRNEKAFKQNPLLAHIKRHFPPVHTFLFVSQPFHPPAEWAATLVHFNNQDKHESLIVIDQEYISKVLIPGSKADVVFCGDSVACLSDNGSMTYQLLPCIAGPFDLVYTTDHRVLTFFLKKGESQVMLLPYAKSAIWQVASLLKAFFDVMPT